MSGTRALVDAERLVRHFRLGADRVVRAVDDVSFRIARGETFGLVGESGSGKSTVARLLLRLERPDSGVVRFGGQDVFALPPRELQRLRREMQVVFQDPYGALNRRKTVEQIVSFPLRVHEQAGRAARAARVSELLDLVGLGPEYARRYPSQMSGGQCQRVGIARALALHPKLVVLDEAVSAVDVSIQAQILNLLRSLQARLGLTYLFISHDLSVVRYMSSTIAVMYLGRIAELGTREQLFERPLHPYTHALMAAIPVPDPVVERSRPRVTVARDAPVEVAAGCRFRPRCPIGRDREVCGAVDPPLADAGDGHLVACHFSQEAERLPA